MSYTRTIKPDFFRSESLAKLPVNARVTFAGLWTEADGGGRGVANSKILKGAIWSLDDDVSDRDVEQYLKMLDKSGHIELYTVDDKRYFQVVRWIENQSPQFRRNPSRLPGPNGECESQEPVVQKQQQSGGKQKGTTAPATFDITDALREWAARGGWDKIINLDTETLDFLDWHAAKGTMWTNWDRAWQRWMRKAHGFALERAERQTTGATSSGGSSKPTGAGRLDVSGDVSDDIVKLPSET